ncbi:Z585B protein, partial [Polypterus senegalus]
MLLSFFFLFYNEVFYYHVTSWIPSTLLLVILLYFIMRSLKFVFAILCSHTGPPDSTNLIAHSGLDTLDLCSQNVARGAGPGVLKIEERVTKQIYGDLKEEDTSVDIDGVSDDCVKQQSVDIRNEEEQLIFKMMVTGMEFLSATKNEEHVDEDLITDLTVKESHLGRTLEGNRSSSPQVCGSPDEPVNEKKLGIELEEKVSEEQAVKDLHTSDRNLKIFSERQHLLSYKGKKSHPCTECGKVFTMTSSLKYHQRVHTANFKLRQGIQSGKKTFKCSECGAFFMSWSQLKIHQGIHTGLEDRRPSEHPQFLADKEITIGPPGGIEVMVPSGLDTLAQYSWNIDRGAGPGVLRNEEGATEQIYRNVKEEDTPVDIARISEVCVKRMEILSASRHEECADEDLITDLKVKEKDLEWTLEGSLSSSQQMCVSGPVNEKKVGIELQVKASEVQAGEDQHISVELLQMPSERRHLKIKQKPHQCTECGKAFTMASSLKYHQRVHMGEKPYKCTECGKTFTVASRLKYHQGVHKGENKHQCIECGKTFSRATNLKAHKRVHTGEKPFQCTECGKTFRWAKYLRIHHRRHTGEKPYRCKECGKTFIRKANFKLHQGIHTGKKTFQCAECGVFFMWPSQLKIHRRTHTGFEGRRTSKFPQVLADKEVTIGKYFTLYLARKFKTEEEFMSWQWKA